MEEKESKSLNDIVNALKELADAQRSLHLAKGAQQKAQRREYVEQVKKNISDYIESASNGYTSRKSEIEEIKNKYQEISEDFAKSHEEDMNAYDLQRQDIESKQTENRSNLAQAQEKKKNLEKNSVVVNYNAAVESCKKSIALAAKRRRFRICKKTHRSA